MNREDFERETIDNLDLIEIFTVLGFVNQVVIIFILIGMLVK